MMRTFLACCAAILMSTQVSSAQAEEELLKPSEAYVAGFRATDLIDQPVRGVDREIIGEVHDLLVGREGRLKGVVVEGGGILGMGEEYMAAPWSGVEIGPNLAYLHITRPDEMVKGLNGSPPVGESGAWAASELIGDPVIPRDGGIYGQIADLVFDDAGRLTSLILDRSTMPEGAASYSIPFVPSGVGPQIDAYRSPLELAELMKY